MCRVFALTIGLTHSAIKAITRALQVRNLGMEAWNYGTLRHLNGPLREPGYVYRLYRVLRIVMYLFTSGRPIWIAAILYGMDVHPHLRVITRVHLILTLRSIARKQLCLGAKVSNTRVRLGTTNGRVRINVPLEFYVVHLEGRVFTRVVVS